MSPRKLLHNCQADWRKKDLTGTDTLKSMVIVVLIKTERVIAKNFTSGVFIGERRKSRRVHVFAGQKFIGTHAG